MLENWCWKPETVQLLAGHYEDESVKIPPHLLKALCQSRVAHAGILNTRQVFLAALDQRLHTLDAIPPPAVHSPPRSGGASDDVRSVEILRELHEKILGIPLTPGTNFLASFGHLVGGYDASYYGYLWSEVYSADMWGERFEKDPMNPSTGASYRSSILAPGGARDALESLVEFLGREPNHKNFLRLKGLC